jgi:hypothetical protein
VEPLPDLGTLGDAELKALIDEYVAEENEVSYKRRLIHGYIDILRTELIARRKRQFEGGELEGVDIDRLSEILAGKGVAPDNSPSE